MSSGPKKQAVHDLRHVAGDAKGRVSGCMPGVTIPAIPLLMALQAHPVRIVPEPQGCGVCRRILRVGVVAASAVRLAFSKTRRTLECLDNECGFAKPAVSIEGFAGELGVWTALVSGRKTLWLADRGLGVTLRANFDILRVADALKGPFLRLAIHVRTAGAMTHLAVHSRLSKTGGRHLAGMARGAVFLIGSELAKAMEGGDFRALGTRRVDHSPIVDPRLFEEVVLNRQDVELTIGRSGGISLLPL